MSANLFKIETQYQLYLKRIGLDESKMHPQQKAQIKQTFFAAFGQCILMLRDDLGELPEDDGIKHLESMIEQIKSFFLDAPAKMN